LPLSLGPIKLWRGTFARHSLVLPLTAFERRLVESIDGVQTIGGILGASQPPDGGDTFARARRLFERLFWYDQVVFDAAHVRQ
jgi:hypothetical protein